MERSVAFSDRKTPSVQVAGRIPTEIYPVHKWKNSASSSIETKRVLRKSEQNVMWELGNISPWGYTLRKGEEPEVRKQSRCKTDFVGAYSCYGVKEVIGNL